VAFLKDRELVAVANGDDGSCRLLDAKSYQSVDRLDFHSDADNLRYDPVGKRLYVGFGTGAIGVIDAATRKRMADIEVGGHPESFQLEGHGSRVFVNVPDARQIAVVDRDKGATIATWRLKGARANFPMALDEGAHRLFVGCRAPAEVLAYDSETGEVSAHFSTVGDADDLFFDEQTKRLYVAGGEGFIAVHQQHGANQYSQLARIPTAAGARTALFSPELSRLYLAVPHRGSQAAELRVYEVVP
jgi:YVTN family beta-propeller protein